MCEVNKKMKFINLLKWLIVPAIAVLVTWIILQHVYLVKLEKTLAQSEQQEVIQPEPEIPIDIQLEQLIQSVTNKPPRCETKIIDKGTFSQVRTHGKIKLLLENYILLWPRPQFQQRKVSLKKFNQLKTCNCDLHQPCWIDQPCDNPDCPCCKKH